MKKIIGLTLVVVMLLLMMVGCSQDKVSEQPPSNDTPSSEDPPQDSSEQVEKQKLEVWLSTDGGTEGTVYTEAFADKYPDIDFHLSYYNSEDYKTQLRLAVDSGTQPDIFYANAGSLFDDYYDAGVCTDLTDIIKENGFDQRCSEGYFENYTKDGRIFGFPIAGVTVWQTLYINKDLFNQYDLQPPTNISQLIEVSKVFNENGVAPVAIGNKDGWPAILLLGDFFVQLSDFDTVNDINNGKEKWTENEAIVNAFTTVIELGREKVFMPGFATQDHVAGIQTYAAGKAAMMYIGSWWTGTTGGTDLGFEIDVIELPSQHGVDEVKAVQMSSDVGMIISSDTENLDAAVKFLDYYTSEEASITRSNIGNNFSVYPGANDKLDLEPLFLKDPIVKQFEKPVTGLFFDWAFPVPVIEVIKTRITQAIDEQITIDQALSDIQAEQDKHIN